MKMASIIFGVIAAVLLIASPAIEQYYGSTKPRQIDPQSGKVYEINVRGGVVVYLNKTEYAIKAFIFYGGVLSAIICGALVASRKKKDYEKGIRGGP